MCYVNFLRGLLRALVVCFLVARGSFALGATISFDDFSVPAAPNVSVTLIGAIDSNPADVATTDPSIEGGSREVTFEVSGVPELVSFAGQVGGGALAFNSSAPGTTATVTYSGLSGSNLNLLGHAFEFDFLYVDGNMSQKLGVMIDVMGTGGGTATRTVDIDNTLVPFMATVPFAGFTGDLSALNDATTIVVHFNPDAYEHLDFSLDDFGVVIPEPSTAVLLIGGLLAAMVYVRRRR